MNFGARSALQPQVQLIQLLRVGLLNPKLVFGTAWFWTLPEVHDVQEEIDALSSQFRRYLGVNDGR